MRLENLDLNLLVLLEALYSENSVSRAGARLGLSQSASSSALGRLRAVFDDDLFRSAGGRLEPTLRAAELREPVLRVLQDIKSSILAPGSTDLSRMSATVRIAAADDFIETTLASTIKAVLLEAPGLKFTVQPINGQVQEMLERNQTDLIVAHRPVMSAQLPLSELYADRYVVIGSPDNPAIQDATISLEDFSRHDYVSIGFTRRGMSRLDELLLERGVPPRKIIIEAPSFLTVPTILAGTGYLSIVPGRLAAHFAAQSKVAVAALPIDLPEFAMCAQWRSTGSSDVLMDILVRRMREVA